ncbi:MAG: HlyC/CorC family transporter [Bradyrhizobiaceae bacterium]|nr:HlyC/CorC family transporter [Bradyrhizobiaceae bacterium]
MSDTDSPRRSEPAGVERTNLPVPVPHPGEVMREGGMAWVARLLRTFLGWKTNSIRADLEVVLETGAAAESGFSPEERAMLKNILGLRERGVEDVMVPRADIIAVQKDILLGELVKVFEVAAHSRLVVYDDTLDDPTGMVHIRDLIGYMANRAAASASTKPRRKKPFTAGLDLNAIDLSVPLSATDLVRTILFVPPSMPAIDLLAKMQATRIHLALVIDEYGGTDGLVSIEDIVEQIVGDIEDEHDEDVTIGVVRQHDGSYLANARASLEEVTATIGAEFDMGEAAQDVDTLGGYLVTRVGRVPVRGELVPGPSGFEIEVLDADPRRVKRVRIYRGKDRFGRRAPKRREDRPEGEAPPPAPSAETVGERSEVRPASDGESS